MNAQTFLSFEQERVDAEEAQRKAAIAARDAAKAERRQQWEAHKAQVAIRKAQEEREKSYRRSLRDAERRDKQPNEHAQCGIRWYCRSNRDVYKGSYWHHCHACGQELIYTSDQNAKPQECAGRKP
jgi:hypothetical protein